MAQGFSTEAIRPKLKPAHTPAALAWGLESLVLRFRIVKIVDDFSEAPRDGSTAVLKRNASESSREVQTEIIPLRWL